MSHFDYYQYQAKARGVHSLDDVRRIAAVKAYVYDLIVLNWLPADKSKPIGELACGHGSFLHWLKTKSFSSIAGVDSSPAQVALARQIDGQVSQNDVNQWLTAQPNDHFGALVAIDLAEHLPKDDFVKLLRAAHSKLSPGGSLILRLPNGESPFVGANLFNDITHIWTYTPNCLNSLGEMCGFSRTEFADEGADAIRDARWIKVPLAKLSAGILRLLTQSATRERIRYFSPNLWARLVK